MKLSLFSNLQWREFSHLFEIILKTILRVVYFSSNEICIGVLYCFCHHSAEYYFLWVILEPADRLLFGCHRLSILTITNTTCITVWQNVVLMTLLRDFIINFTIFQQFYLNIHNAYYKVLARTRSSTSLYDPCAIHCVAHLRVSTHGFVEPQEGTFAW